MLYRTIAAEMIQAVNDEIEAMKAGGGGRDIPVYDGSRTGVSAGHHLYKFVAEHELTVPDDAPALLKVGERAYEVTVVDTDGFEVAVATSEDLGVRIPFAALNVAPYFLLERLRDRLKEGMEGRLLVNKDMTLTLFNRLQNVKIPVGSQPDFQLRGDAPPPNDAQREAVLRALSQRITFIWGPPGTGKTTTVNHLVPALLKDGERVLITSHTNAAVDQVLKAAMKGMSEQEIHDGAIVRLGQPREESEIQYILLPEVVKRKTPVFQDRLRHLEIELASAREEERKWAWWEEKFREIASLASQHRENQTRLSLLRDQVDHMRARMPERERERERLEARLREAETSGFLRRLFLGLDPRKIQAEIDACDTEIARLKQETAAKRNEIADIEPLLNSIETQRQRLEKEMNDRGPVPGADEVSSNLERWGKRVSMLKKEVDDVVRQISMVPSEVVKQARVVGTTLSKLATTRELYETHFDTVIIDEVSMIPQPYLWFCSGLADRRVVLLGDFRQLPPICVAETPAARTRIARSIFEEAGILDPAGKVVEGDGRLCKLRKQYRMHEDIGELANVLVYARDGNSLEHLAGPDQTERGSLADPCSGRPLVLCDTSSVDPWCARQSVGYSRYNLYTAALAVRMARTVVRGDGGIEVGVISPYAAQARLIRELVEAEGLGKQVKVATVHRFQGNEKDVIIIDLVDGKPFEPGKLLVESQASCLLNVSITRAKGKVIVISNVAYFAEKLGEGPLLTLHEYLLDRAEQIDARIILSGYGDPDVTGAELAMSLGRQVEEVKSFSGHNESSFYPVFLRDVSDAKEEVIIFSPFVERLRTSQVVPVLRSAVERGVTVRVFTRRYRTGTVGAALLDELSGLDIQVVRTSSLHEKLALIDERILWAGSLNILSHRQTTEIMVRIDNPDIASLLMQYTNAAHKIRRMEDRSRRETLLELIEEVLRARREPPSCPKCGTTMRLRVGRYGFFWSCPNYPRDTNTVNIAPRVIREIIEELEIPCPTEGCEGYMRLRRSKTGVFLACSRYPDCRATISLS